MEFDELKGSKEGYWAQFFDMEHDEVLAWRYLAEKKNDEVLRLMRTAC